MPYVFISYMRENRDQVERIRSRIEDIGVEVWIDTQNIRPGEDWERATRRGIEDSSCCLVCFSREFQAKERSFMHEELRLAVLEARNRGPDRRWLLPILLSPCEIPDYEIGADLRLGKLERIDLTPDWEDGMERILIALQPLAEPPPIIVLGSGNGDFVLTHSTPITMGTKNFVDSEQLLGGSGLNASARLLAAGFNAAPILSVGPDRLGEMVRDHLVGSAQGTEFQRSSSVFLSDESFFASEIKTPQSTIVVDGDRRTIFAEKLSGGRHYFSHVLARLDKILARGRGRVAAVLIGHIHTDGRFRPDGTERDAERWGECTRYLIDKFADKCPVLLNFGRNQIDLGVKFWESDLENVAMVQFNIEEAKSFFSELPGMRSSQAILHWFQERKISFALTFGKFGAAATYRDGHDGGILAWPVVNPAEVKDTTGAGDAFAAGVVSALQGRFDVGFPEFFDAVRTGRLWAGYACRLIGACSDPPDKKTLEEFAAERNELSSSGKIRNVELLRRLEFYDKLQTFDAIFSD